MLISFLSGAIAIASLVIATFFWQFQRRTKDRLFGFFAAAFLLLAVERVFIEFLSNTPGSDVYLIRLAAFLLILFAIAGKNRKTPRDRSP